MFSRLVNHKHYELCLWGKHPAFPDYIYLAKRQTSAFPRLTRQYCEAQLFPRILEKTARDAAGEETILLILPRPRTYTLAYISPSHDAVGRVQSPLVSAVRYSGLPLASIASAVAHELQRFNRRIQERRQPQAVKDEFAYLSNVMERIMQNESHEPSATAERHMLVRQAGALDHPTMLAAGLDQIREWLPQLALPPARAGQPLRLYLPVFPHAHEASLAFWAQLIIDLIRPAWQLCGLGTRSSDTLLFQSGYNPDCLGEAFCRGLYYEHFAHRISGYTMTASKKALLGRVMKKLAQGEPINLQDIELSRKTGLT